MNKFLELEIRTYQGKEYKDYLQGQEDTEDEGNEWKKALINVPKSTPTKVLLFDTSVMQVAIETASIEATEENPEKPINDSVDLYLKEGLILTLVGDMNKFKKKLKEFYTEKV